MKNEVGIQSQPIYLRKNQIGLLAIALSNRPQGCLLSNIEDPRREGKEHCKLINLRFRKNVHIPVSVPKKSGTHFNLRRSSC